MTWNTTLATLALGVALSGFACERRTETTYEPATPAPAEAPSATEEEPAMPGEAPPATGEEPAMPSEAPPAAGEEPAMPGEMPPTPAEAPPTPATPVAPAEPSPAAEPPRAPEEPAVPLSAARMADANVLASLIAIHGHEVTVSAFVLDRLQNPQVRALAQKIHDDHRAALEQTQQLASDLALRPMGDEQTAQLASVGLVNHLMQLAPLSGPELDRAFVQMMLEGHRAVLAKIDDDLMKQASDPAVKGILLAVRPIIVQHMEMSEAILPQLQ